MMSLKRMNSCRRVAVYGPLVLDIDGERASIGATDIILQQSDWAILSRLAKADSVFVRGDELLAEIWGEDMRDDTAFLRSWVHRLNDRLCACGPRHPIIDTIPGGYRLVSPAEWNSEIEAVAV